MRTALVDGVPEGVPLESLRILATILWRARDNAAKGVDDLWWQGLTGWGLGTVAYELCRCAIARAQISGEFPWLRLRSESPEFVFEVHGVPFKFYRGDEESRASERHRTPSVFENGQQEFDFGDERDPEHTVVHRFIISTTAKGVPETVYYAQVTGDGKVHNPLQLRLVGLSRVDIAFRRTDIPLIETKPETLEAVRPARRAAVQDVSASKVGEQG